VRNNEQVRVDTGGFGISWNDEIDLSCDELYDNGIESRDFALESIK
jgi:hypothetical protein